MIPMQRSLLVPLFLAAACGAFAQDAQPARPAPSVAVEARPAEAKFTYQLIVEEYAFTKDALTTELATASDRRALLLAAVKRGEATLTVRAGTSTETGDLIITHKRTIPFSDGAGSVSYREVGVFVQTQGLGDALDFHYRAEEIGAGTKPGNESMSAVSKIEFSTRIPLEFGKPTLLGVVPPDEAVPKSRAVIVRMEKQK